MRAITEVNPVTSTCVITRIGVTVCYRSMMFPWMTLHPRVCIQVTELAGYTARVHNMFLVFGEVQRGVYKRSEDSTTATGAEMKNQPSLHIEGPMEIKGQRQPEH